MQSISRKRCFPGEGLQHLSQAAACGGGVGVSQNSVHFEAETPQALVVTSLEESGIVHLHLVLNMF